MANCATCKLNYNQVLECTSCSSGYYLVSPILCTSCELANCDVCSSVLACFSCDIYSVYNPST